MNLVPGTFLAYSFEPEARYWQAISTPDPGMPRDIIIQARWPRDGCQWEFVVEEHPSGIGLSRSSSRVDLNQARDQAPELFAALAELRPRTLEDVRAILVHLGAEDVTIR